MKYRDCQACLSHWLEGGTQGAVVDLGIAIEGCDGGVVEVVCEGALVYMAEVQEQLIVGYPFCKTYGLIVDPVRDCLMDALCASECGCPAQVRTLLQVSGAGSAPQSSSGSVSVVHSGGRQRRTKNYCRRLIDLASD